MKYLLLFVFQILLINSSVQAQLKTNVDFEQKIPLLMAENNVPAVGIGIIEGGEITYIKVFGELKEGISAPDNTIFNVASITKPFVAMLTLKLVESGEWDLDEPLFYYWIDPDITNNPYHKILTTRHILTHQSGFLNWRKQHPSKKLTFEFEPGIGYQYSGEGFVYLAHALEKKFNKSLVELADSILFNPLGMKDSRLYWDKNMDESRFAYWHNSEGNLHKPSTSRDRDINAASSMLTTVEDFCKFEIDVINGAGLSPNLYKDMIKVCEPDERGLGWGVLNPLPNGEYVLHHDGSDIGVQTFSAIWPESKRAIVVFTNGDNGMLIWRKVLIESLDEGKDITNSFFGTKTHEIINLPDSVLQQYTGQFKDNYGRVFTFIKEDKALIFSGTGVPTLKLYPQTEHVFFPKEFEFQFQFVTSDSLVIVANGKIDSISKRIK